MTLSRRIRLAPRADEDLSDVLQYTANMWGQEQAIAYRSTLSNALEELALFPGLGRARNDLGSGIRSYVVGQHVIIYRSTDDEVIVSRIVHIRRNLERVMRG